MMQWHDIPGWCDYEDFYASAVLAAPDGATLVEVGCWLGRSTAYLSNLIALSRKPIALYAVDNFTGPPNAAPMYAEIVARHGGNIRAAFDANMAECGASVNAIQGDSAEAAKQFADGSVWFAFIDADHSYLGVKRDIAAWTPKIAKGGILAGHDYDMDGVKAAVDEAFGARAAAVSTKSWMVRM